MGIMDFFKGGGGYGQHNPEYRRQSEDLMMMQQMGQLLQDNPAMMEYFTQSPEGQKIAQKLGLDLTGGGFGITGLPDIGEYEGLQQGYEGLDYQPSSFSEYQYETPELSGIPDEAYRGVQMDTESGMQRGLQRALAEIGPQMAGRNLGPSGMQQAQGSSLGRNFMNQLGTMTQQNALQKARDKMDMSRYQAGLDMQRQQAQAGEGRFGSQLREGQAQFAPQFGMNKLGGIQNAMAARAGRAMTPYNLGQQYFSGTQGLTGPPKSSSGFSKALGGIGQVAKVAANVAAPFVGGGFDPSTLMGTGGGSVGGYGTLGPNYGYKGY